MSMTRPCFTSAYARNTARCFHCDQSGPHVDRHEPQEAGDIGRQLVAQFGLVHHKVAGVSESVAIDARSHGNASTALRFPRPAAICEARQVIDSAQISASSDRTRRIPVSGRRRNQLLVVVAALAAAQPQEVVGH
jgi:hypothetical protein